MRSRKEEITSLYSKLVEIAKGREVWTLHSSETRAVVMEHPNTGYQGMSIEEAMKLDNPSFNHYFCGLFAYISREVFNMKGSSGMFASTR